MPFPSAASTRVPVPPEHAAVSTCESDHHFSLLQSHPQQCGPPLQALLNSRCVPSSVLGTVEDPREGLLPVPCSRRACGLLGAGGLAPRRYLWGTHSAPLPQPCERPADLIPPTWGMHGLWALCIPGSLPGGGGLLSSDRGSSVFPPPGTDPSRRNILYRGSPGHCSLLSLSGCSPCTQAPIGFLTRKRG